MDEVAVDKGDRARIPAWEHEEDCYQELLMEMLETRDPDALNGVWDSLARYDDEEDC